MQKSDYIQFIIENIRAFALPLPEDLQDPNRLQQYLSSLDENALKIVASFNQNALKYFFKIAPKKDKGEITSILRKLEQISSLIGPTGDLSYLSSNQIDYVLNKLDSIEASQITPEKVILIADEQLEKEFGGGSGQYSQSKAFENQLSSAKFYLKSIGYTQQDINEKLEGAKTDPSKLDELFNLQPKEIYGMPDELEAAASNASSQNSSSTQEGRSEGIIDDHINSVSQEISNERAQEVVKIIQDIQSHAKNKLTDRYKKVYKQMHPDRLKRAYKFLKDTKRKDDRMDLYLEWFFSSHLLENIELKVEHWQVSSHASHDSVGVYTAGFSFARYDNIIQDFSDRKLSKVISIARKILQNPTKKRIQKLGQDLISETGFDEHLYFTD